MSVSDDIRDLRNQVNSLSTTVAGGLEQYKVIATQQQKLLDKLTRIVLDGNGNDSLLTEVAVIKEQLKRGVKTFTEIKLKQDAIKKKMDEKHSEEVKGKWKLIIAVATGIFGIGSAIVLALLK